MNKAKKIVKWALPVSALFGTVFMSLVIAHAFAKASPFLTLTSPGGVYTVNLTGSKGRPYFFTNTVRFSVLKSGQPYLSDTYLHSGDAFDPSFEVGYPDHRWPHDNVVQFYRKEAYDKSKADTLIVVNRTNEVVKYLRIQSEDKFLLFDIQPGGEITLSVSPSRGDLKWVEAEGEFSHGRHIGRHGVDFKIRKELGGAFTFYIYLNENGSNIESPQLENFGGS